MKSRLALMLLLSADFLFIDDHERRSPWVKALCLFLRTGLAVVFLYGGLLCYVELAAVNLFLRLFISGAFLLLGGWVLFHAIRLIWPRFLEKKRR